jgi:hypothetical protein
MAGVLCFIVVAAPPSSLKGLTYDEWVKTNGLPTTAGGRPGDAPAGDGIPNLIKFATGLAPKVPGPAAWFEPVVVERGGQRFFALRLPHSQSAQGIHLGLMGSTDLVHWTRREVILEKMTDLGQGLEQVQLIDTHPLNNDGTRLFYRIEGRLNLERGQLVVGPAVSSRVTTVTADGGKFTAPLSSPQAGEMVVTVPPGAYSGNQALAVRSYPITGHSFPSNIQPASPLIQVEDGGGFAGELITLTVPINLPPDAFAMGFFYRPDTGELEGMPLVALSPTSITVATRHFSYFFISWIDASKLPATADSGFKPGVDDWEFTNYGSYLAPGGHCSGQCQSEMWYYSEKRLKGAKPLFGLYDNPEYSFKTPLVRDDNTLGYKLASRVQADTDWDSAAYEFWRTNDAPDLDTLHAFNYSIWVTKEPQLVFIYTTNAAHAMVVYKVQGNRMLIADPNYPGKRDRLVEYNTNKVKFDPYYSGNTAESLGTPFPRIIYAAKTAINDWVRIGQRWAELDAETIGEGDFPVITITSFERQGEQYIEKASFTTDAPSETPIPTQASEFKFKFAIPGVDPPGVFIRIEDVFGQSVNWLPNFSMIPIRTGTNRVGIYLAKAPPGQTNRSWAGYAWLTIVKEATNRVEGITSIPVYGGSPSAMVIFGTWTATGENIRYTEAGTATQRGFALTARTNSPIHFQWDFKVMRLPGAITNHYADGGKLVTEYLQPTITEGVNVVVNPYPAGLAVSREIKTNSIALDFTITNRTQTVGLMYTLYARHAFTRYDSQEKVIASGAGRESETPHIRLVFDFNAN